MICIFQLFKRRNVAVPAEEAEEMSLGGISEPFVSSTSYGVSTSLHLSTTCIANNLLL